MSTVGNAGIRHGKRLPFAIAALAGHGLVVLFLIETNRGPRQPELSAVFESQMIFIEPPPAAHPEPAKARNSQVPVPLKASMLQPESAAIAPAIEGTPAAPRVDWQDAAVAAARAAAEQSARPGGTEFSPAPRSAIRACKPRRPSVNWQPPRVKSEPGAIVLQLGKGCILVFAPLPIVTCAIGKSALEDVPLDGAKDPTHANNSVPEFNECETG